MLDQRALILECFLKVATSTEQRWTVIDCRQTLLKKDKTAKLARNLPTKAAALRSQSVLRKVTREQVKELWTKADDTQLSYLRRAYLNNIHSGSNDLLPPVEAIKELLERYKDRGEISNFPELRKHLDASDVDRTADAIYWRSILVDLLSDAPSPEVLKFVLADLPEDPVKERQIPFKLSKFLAGLRSAARTTDLNAYLIEHNIEANEVERRALKQLSEALGEYGESRSNQSSTIPDEVFDDTLVSVSDTDFLVTRVMSKKNNSEFKLEVKGVVSGERLFPLSKTRLRKLGLPSHHDVKGNVDAGVKVSEGEYCYWKLTQTRHGRSGSVEFAKMGRLLNVVDVPFSSNDKSSLGSWIVGDYEPDDSVCPIFMSSDGYYFYGKRFKSRYGAADVIFSFFKTGDVSVFLIDGIRVVISGNLKFDVPASLSSSELEILAIISRRSIFDHIDSVNLEELRKLIESADSNSLLAGESPNALRFGLSRLLQVKSLRGELIHLLSELPEVAVSLKEKWSLENSALLAKNESLQISLNDKHRLIEEALSKYKNELEIEKRALEDGIDRSFRDICANKVRIFSEQLLYRSLFRLSDSGSLPKAKSFSFDSIEGDLRTILDDPKRQLDDLLDLRSISEAAGIYAHINDVFGLAVIESMLTDGVILLFGTHVRHYETFVAKILSNGISCEVYVSSDTYKLDDLTATTAVLKLGGRSVVAPLGECINFAQRVGATLCLILKSFNSAPPESYLPRLLESCKSPDPNCQLFWKDGRGITDVVFNAPIFVVLEPTFGQSTFPLSTKVCPSLASVNCSFDWPDEFPIERSSIDEFKGSKRVSMSFMRKIKLMEGGKNSLWEEDGILRMRTFLCRLGRENLNPQDESRTSLGLYENFCMSKSAISLAKSIFLSE